MQQRTEEVIRRVKHPWVEDSGGRPIELLLSDSSPPCRVCSVYGAKMGKIASPHPVTGQMESVDVAHGTILHCERCDNQMTVLGRR